MISKIKVFCVVILVGLFLFSCKNNPGGNIEGQREFADALSNLTGDDYRVVKKNTLVEGFIVLKNSDTGEYVAYNIKNYSKGMSPGEFSTFINQLEDSSFASDLTKGTTEVVEEVTEWVDTSDYGYEWVYDENSQSYVQEEVWITDGYWDTYERLSTITVYRSESGLVFQEGSKETKDLEKLGHFLEKETDLALGSYISSNYGLSEERSLFLAKLAKSFNKIKKNRGITRKDLKKMSLKALGSSLEAFEKAFLEGDLEMREDLLITSSKLNGTGPEHMKRLIKDFLIQ
ncbi:MAG: hypothetical protein VYD54_03905 [Bdellovibrionota bacterium]|nr:hypothetical protein [Bdellovibrionota bacterium]